VILAATTALATLADGAGAPLASAQSCPDVQVVFARGTGEQPGVGRVGQAFADALQTDVKQKSVAVYPVNYPASDDFLLAADGANDASAFIQDTAARCPDTKIVLGGFSQGAAVVDLVTVADEPKFGFDNTLPPEMADHIAAVAVFGNPSNRLEGPLTAISPLYGSKAIDLCNGADPVCSGGDDVSAHSDYVQAGMPSDAAHFAAAHI
jgi:cutinase